MSSSRTPPPRPNPRLAEVCRTLDFGVVMFRNLVDTAPSEDMLNDDIVVLGLAALGVLVLMVLTIVGVRGAADDVSGGGGLLG